MAPDGERKKRILSLAEDVFKVARNQVPRDWARTNLTMPQLKVLLSIFVEGSRPCSSLAQTVSVSLPTMNGILHRLKERGLIARQPDSQDRRRVLNSLSPRGHELVKGLWVSGLDWLSELLDRMSNAELENVEQALTILARALRREEQYVWTG
ncbi:MAG: MarR family transcriptional regulator [Chloroflexota bacterium]|nr:MarR family transcriptional regulator [Chloroflexota bacterium]